MLASCAAARVGAQGSASGLNGRAAHPAKTSRPMRASRLAVQAAKGKSGELPPDVPKSRDRQGGKEWLQSILSRFGPVKEKASNTTVLDFEKPLVELDNRIKEVRPASALPPRGARRRRRRHRRRRRPRAPTRRCPVRPAGAPSGGGERRGRVQPDQGAGGARQAGAARIGCRSFRVPAGGRRGGRGHQGFWCGDASRARQAL